MSLIRILLIGGLLATVAGGPLYAGAGRIPESAAASVAWNEVTPNDDGLVLHNPRFSALWSPQGLRFTPKRGPEWRWSLDRVVAGKREVPLLRECRFALAEAPRRVECDRGAVIEQYVLGLRSIEQRFVLTRKLSDGAVDLVIEGSVRSAGEWTESVQGWTWADEAGVVSMGRVSVFDAEGKAVASRTKVSADHTAIIVDGSALASAVYPVTVDPQIGTDDFRISDMGGTGNSAFAAQSPAVAYNVASQEYLVVWHGEEVDGDFEIFGQRLSAATGAPLGTNDFQISNMGNGAASYTASSAAVAYNSTNNEYLVIWHGDDNTGALVDGEFEIYGQRLDATGNLIGARIRISQMGPDGTNAYVGADAAVAYNPTANEYLVVWRGTDDVVASGETEIYGQRLNAATGAAVGTDDFRISDSGNAGDLARLATSPQVAYNPADDEYLVVWFADDLAADNDFEIFGQRLTSAGVEVGANDFRISDVGPEGDPRFRGVNPSVAYNGDTNEYLVVWTGNETITVAEGFDFDIYGQRLNADTGAAVGTNDFRISFMGEDADNLSAGRSAVTYSASRQEYFVVWDGADTSQTGREIWGQRLDAAGNEVGVDDARLSFVGAEGDTTRNAFNPRVAADASGVTLTVWQADDDGAGLADNEFEIFGQLYDLASSLVRGDFNGDDKPDLLWRNYTTGAVNAWLLDGTTYLGGADLFTVPDPNWRIEATGDFDGNGSSDLVWRNYASGAVNVWFLDGTTYLGGANLFTVADLNWKIQAAGDFNGDGKDDLIWRNYATGAVNVWFLNGTAYLGGANLFTVADANWRIEVAGDYNGDGETDLIWRNYASGVVNVWFLDGTTYLGGASLFTVAGANWDIEATGDYNGDGKLDLIWRNYGTGAVNVWFLNGTAYLSGASLFTVVDANWEIAGPR